MFDNMLHSDQSLFKNEIALDYSFIPKLIPYRESQQKYIASCIKPLFHERNGKNLLVYGKPGVGKTVACKHIFQELEEETDDVILIYINCWQKNTSFKIMTDICDKLGIKFVQNKKTDELFGMAKNVVNKKAVVFAFDEVDKAEEFDFLYSILEDVYRKSVLLITNYKSWLDNLDERIKSRLSGELLEFKHYDLEETRGILKQRMEYAFVPGAFSKEAFELIVKKTAGLEDIRKGLHLMKEAANIAEDRSSKQISLDDAKKSIGKLDEFSIKDSAELLEDERAILDLVRDGSGGKIGDLFKSYKDKGGSLAYRTFQRKINRLEEGKFVSLEKTEGGVEGNTTIVKLREVNKKLGDF